MGRHTGSCERARSHVCRCSGCAGTRHGWVGCVQAAQQPSGQLRHEVADRADRAWNNADRMKRRSRGKPTRAEQAAATDTVIADLVEWMALHPTAAEQIDAIATALGDEVVVELDRSLEGDRRTRVGRLLADHAWCGMLAALAAILNEVQKQVDQIPNITADTLIMQMRKRGTSSWIKERQVEIYLKIAWKSLQEVLPTVEQPRRAVRMLAVMICPAPERHDVVLKHCAHPLTGECVSTVTKHRLAQALPDYFGA